MIPKPIDMIEFADLEFLKSNGVRERRDLEFKRRIPSNSEDEGREFLADVTAMANSQGGDIIYGIAEEKGVAGDLIGVSLENPDAEFLRIESQLQSGTDPRLSGVRLRWIEQEPGHGFIVLRVPASLSSPHAARKGTTRRFYARSSGGKYEMDTHELRQAFLATDQLPRQMRDLHRSAVIESRGDNMPFQIDSQPSVVLSVIPMRYFRDVRNLPMTPETAVAPHQTKGHIDATITLEGILLSTRLNRHTIADTDAVLSYAHTHSSGRVDAAWCIARMDSGLNQPHRLIDPSYFEAGAMDIARAATARLSQHGVAGPWVLTATIQAILDFPLIIDEHRLSKPAFRSGATLRELIVDTASETTLVPLFESFWRLFGVIRPGAMRN